MADRDKFDYVLQLAWQFPVADWDDDGNVFEMPHYTRFWNDRQVEKALQELNLSEEDFLKQEQIIPVLKAYGLDIEQFWLAVVYIAQLTHMWSDQKGIMVDLPPALNQLTRLREELTGRHEFKVLIDNPTESHTIEIAGNRLMGILRRSLDELIENERSSDMATMQEIPIWRNDVVAKKTEMTWYAANMFKRLFDTLKLPVIRSRNTKKEYRTIAGEDVLVKGKDAVVSYDKNQLIAELIHFMDLTDNPNLDGNSIKGILKSERKFDIDIL